MREFFSKVKSTVEKFFNIKEIENSNELKIISFLLLLNILLFFFKINQYVVQVNEKLDSICWPFFQSCNYFQDIIFLNSNLEFRGILTLIIFSTLSFSFYFFLKNEYRKLFYSLLFIFTFFLLPIFIFAGYHGDFIKYPEQYLFYLTFIFLFINRGRIFFLKIFFLLSYFLSTISKFESDTWMLGFWDLPYLTPTIVPLATNFVIIFQLFLIFLLTHKNRKIVVFSLLLSELFHLYTLTFITPTFFFITAPFLFVLFYENKDRFDFRKITNSMVGLIFIVFLFSINLIRLVIPLNDSETFEGSYYGFNMYQSFHSCKYEYLDEKYIPRKIFLTGLSNLQKCTPYNVLVNLQKNCTSIEKPRYLILNIEYANKIINVVSVNNYCELKYKPFSHNNWINPVILENKDIKLNIISGFFNKHKSYLEFLYTFIFFVILTIFIYKSTRK